MRWKKITNFVLAIFFSVAYFIVALFTLVGTTHPPAVTDPNAPPQALPHHPWLSLVYLVLALLISWGVYYYFREKSGFASFLVTILVGIGVICAGIVFWVTAVY